MTHAHSTCDSMILVCMYGVFACPTGGIEMRRPAAARGFTEMFRGKEVPFGRDDCRSIVRQF